MSFDRRLTKPEGIFIQHVVTGCASCGLRHVQPLTIAMVRGIIGPLGGTDAENWWAAHRRQPRCACANAARSSAGSRSGPARSGGCAIDRFGSGLDKAE
jgi:hypothetical protein